MNKGASLAIEGRVFNGFRFENRCVVFRSGKIVDDAQPASIWRLHDGQTLLPGFHDHHTHLVGTSRPPRGPNLDGASTRQELLGRLDRWLRAHPGVTPVVGEGWDESIWDDPRRPRGEEIDAVEKNRPIALRRVCGHLAILNEAAWRDLSPSGEEADRSSGTITETLALNLSRSWPPSAADQIEGVDLGQKLAARHGVTGIDELGTIETYRAFRHLAGEGRLFLRVNHFFPLPDRKKLPGLGLTPTDREGRLRIVGLKGFLDGSFGARTAAVEQRYFDEGGTGRLLWETEELVEAVSEGARAGFGMALHAIGIRAIRQAMTAYERLPDDHPGLRRIEHAEEADDAAFRQGGSLGVTWSMQPNFTARWQGIDGMYDVVLGSERAARLNRFRSAHVTGPLLFGSDNMPLGPLEGLIGAIEPRDPAERLDLADALRAYMFPGLGKTGDADMLAPGSCADLVVLDHSDGDLQTSIRSKTTRVVWTAALGRPVWSDPALAIPSEFGEPDR